MALNNALLFIIAYINDTMQSSDIWQRQ